MPILIVVFLIITLFAACNKTKTEYLIEVPSESRQVGYLLTLSGTFASSSNETGKYKTFEGENIIFNINMEDNYSSDNIIVKDNGNEITLTDISDEYTKRFSFELNSVQEAHKITVEGLELKKYSVKFGRSRYAENEEDTVGTVFEDYDDRFIAISYNGANYYSIASAINAINSKNITINHGEVFELWVGEKHANSYFSRLDVCVADNDFNGIMGQKSGEVVDRDYSVSGISYMSNAYDDNEQPIKEGNLYKLELVVKEDVTLYFDTIVLSKSKSSYYLQMPPCDVYEVVKEEPEDNQIYFDTPWRFRIVQKITDGSVNYDNMKVYVNGEEVTSTNGIYSFVGRPPSTFNEGINTNYSLFEISVSDIDLGAYSLVKFKLNPSEGVSINYAIQNEQDEYIFLTPFYLENGYTYFYKSDLPQAYIVVDAKYDCTDMIIKANGSIIEEDMITPVEQHIMPNSKVFSVNFGGDYANEIVLDVEEIKLQKIQYKVKNSFAGEVDMFIDYKGQKQLVISELTFVLAHDEIFELNVHSKNQGTTDITEYGIEGVSEDNIIGIGTGMIEDMTITNSKTYTIKVNAYIDGTGRVIDVVKDTVSN